MIVKIHLILNNKDKFHQNNKLDNHIQEVYHLINNIFKVFKSHLQKKIFIKYQI